MVVVASGLGEVGTGRARTGGLDVVKVGISGDGDDGGASCGNDAHDDLLDIRQLHRDLSLSGAVWLSLSHSRIAVPLADKHTQTHALVPSNYKGFSSSTDHDNEIRWRVI